jgi:hypothetical protein
VSIAAGPGGLGDVAGDIDPLADARELCRELLEEQVDVDESGGLSAFRKVVREG